MASICFTCGGQVEVAQLTIFEEREVYVCQSCHKLIQRLPSPTAYSKFGKIWLGPYFCEVHRWFCFVSRDGDPCSIWAMPAWAWRFSQDLSLGPYICLQTGWYFHIANAAAGREWVQWPSPMRLAAARRQAQEEPEPEPPCTFSGRTVSGYVL